MKKLFLLALVLLLASNVVFAEDSAPVLNKKIANATLTLDLTGNTSVVNAGFLEAAPSKLEDITSSTSSVTVLPISVTDESMKEMKTADVNFYVFWYINALKGEGSSLSLEFSRFISHLSEGQTDPNPDYIGYTVKYTFDGNNCNGEIKPANNTGENSVDSLSSDSKHLELISGNTNSGLSVGYLTLTIPGFSYSGVSAKEYVTQLALTVTAP